MKQAEQKRALGKAVEAALAAGGLMRENFRAAKKVNLETHHDIKLELDVRCQERIERILRGAFPDIAILGEEGVSGDPEAEYRWVVDPIDGTVNFAYGIPHACTSIALQVRRGNSGDRRGQISQSGVDVALCRRPKPGEAYETLAGVVYDPFCNEMWTGLRGGPARLNGRVIRVSERRRVREAMVAIGFAKYDETLEGMLPVFNGLIRRVRKVRLMGAAALSMVYVASGRMDAYIEAKIRLWDIAAGGLILECAGGEFYFEPVEGEYTYRIVANNGLLRRKLLK